MTLILYKGKYFIKISHVSNWCILQILKLIRFVNQKVHTQTYFIYYIKNYNKFFIVNNTI